MSGAWVNSDEPETVAITDSHVIVAFIRHTDSTEEVWCTDYICLPLNSLTTYWTQSDFIHVQVAFKVRISGGGRAVPEDTLMTFSVDNKRGTVHAYDRKDFTDEYAWEFISYNLNRVGKRHDGLRLRQIDAAYEFCEAQLGKPASVFGMLTGDCFSCGGENRESYYCTKLVLHMFHEVGELRELDAANTTPAELYKELSTRCTRRGLACVIPHPRTFDTKDIEF